MIDEEIIGKAGSDWQQTHGTMRDYLKRVIKLAREDEREACALVCEEIAKHWIEEIGCITFSSDLANECAEAIRAQGEK